MTRFTAVPALVLLLASQSFIVSPTAPAAEAPECDCTHLQTLLIELGNARRLQQAFRNKIPDLRQLGVDTSQAELQRFASGEARRGLEPIPGYDGPQDVDYVPYGQDVHSDNLHKFDNQQLCSMTESATRKLTEAINKSACVGVGEALRAHEDVHANFCRTIGYRPYLAMHGADRAREEAEAYGAQIAKLEQVLEQAVKTCKFKLTFESEIERRQGMAVERGVVRASLDLRAVALEENVLKLGPDETALKYIEYIWADGSECSHAGTRGSDGRFKVTQGQLELGKADGTASLTLASVKLTVAPGQTSEVHMIDCGDGPMSFPGAYWSPVFVHFHGSAEIEVSGWSLVPVEPVEARKVFEATKECNKALCREKTTLVLRHLP